MCLYCFLVFLCLISVSLYVIIKYIMKFTHLSSIFLSNSPIRILFKNVIGLDSVCIRNFCAGSTKTTGLHGNEFGFPVIMYKVATVDHQATAKMIYIKFLYFIVVPLFKNSL